MTRPVRTSAPTKECVACHDRLGDKELPVFVKEDNGEGLARTETWCPQCFVSIRALRDGRWYEGVRLGQILAVHCTRCGVTSVDMGRKMCGQCDSRQIVVLLPKGTVLDAAAVRAFAGKLEAAGRGGRGAPRGVA